MRIVVQIDTPFSEEEFIIGYLYTLERYSSMDGGSSSFKSTAVRSEAYRDSKGQPAMFLKKQIHVSKGPKWLSTISKQLQIRDTFWLEPPRSKSVFSTRILGKPLQISVRSELIPSLTKKPFRTASKTYSIDLSECERYEPSNSFTRKENPREIRIAELGVGPLRKGWSRNSVTTMYKEVTIDLDSSLQKIFGTSIVKSVLEMYSRFHRLMYIWSSEWSQLSLDQAWALHGLSRSSLSSNIQSMNWDSLSSSL